MKTRRPNRSILFCQSRLDKPDLPCRVIAVKGRGKRMGGAKGRGRGGRREGGRDK